MSRENNVAILSQLYKDLINELETTKAVLKKYKKLYFEAEERAEKAEREIDRDFLTGLYSERGLAKAVEPFVEMMNANGNHQFNRRNEFAIECVSAIFVDLDGLKMFNDLYGHKVGSEYIRTAGALFKKSVREIDMVGRLGSAADEFLIILLNTTEDEAYRIASEFCRKLAEVKVSGVEDDVRCSGSFGVATITKGGKFCQLKDSADKAMYEAKINRGKNTVVKFSEL